MPVVRRLIAQRHLALLICACALLLRLVVPAGYMIDSDGGRVTVTLCPGTVAPSAMAAMPGMVGGMDHHDHSKEHGKGDMPCAFAGAAIAMLGAVDPIQLAALIAFVMATGFATAMLPVPARAARLRPPSHGPPAHL